MKSFLSFITLALLLVTEITFAENSPLPGNEGLNFEAFLNMNNVDLRWTTSSESANSCFTIEKSRDGVKFKEAGKVNAGSTSVEVAFFDKDFRPYKGISYYRLKQTDASGTITYSNIVPVENKKDETAARSIFGNIDTQLNVADGQEILVVLTDIAGNEVFSKVIISGKHLLNVVDPESKLAPGSYLITASSANKYYCKKIKVK